MKGRSWMGNIDEVAVQWPFCFLENFKSTLENTKNGHEIFLGGGARR
jgi:hypothetical protein